MVKQIIYLVFRKQEESVIFTSDNLKITIYLIY